MAFLSQRKENEGPDVIILDLKMPDMSGLDVLRKVKKSFPENRGDHGDRTRKRQGRGGVGEAARRSLISSRNPSTSRRS
ncbi:MAG: hypothetical protein MZU95_17595 [Desulfomicrobium escambiense]|nr:hypothetical protein [Desulfomicrobium escambiense]